MSAAARWSWSRDQEERPSSAVEIDLAPDTTGAPLSATLALDKL